MVTSKNICVLGQQVGRLHQWLEGAQSCPEWRCRGCFHLSTKRLEGIYTTDDTTGMQKTLHRAVAGPAHIATSVYKCRCTLILIL